MSTDSHEPRPFDCPDCGHHHKADLHGMVGHPEIHGKVPCVGCGKTLWLSLDEDGEALVELYEEHLHEAIHQGRIAAHKAKLDAAAAQAESATTATTPSSAAAAAGPPLILSIIVAGVVALVVSLALGGNPAQKDNGAEKSDKTAVDDNNDARTQSMASEIQELKAAAASARTGATAAAAKLADLEKMIQLEVATQRESAGADPAMLKAIQAKSAAFTEALGALQASYKSLHGRIEGNYTSLRLLDKRLKSLEAR